MGRLETTTVSRDFFARKAIDSKQRRMFHTAVRLACAARRTRGKGHEDLGWGLLSRLCQKVNTAMGE